MLQFELPREIKVEDLERLPDDCRYELHHGELRVMAPVAFWDTRISHRLVNYFEARGLATDNRVGILLGPNDTRTADVAVFIESGVTTLKQLEADAKR